MNAELIIEEKLNEMLFALEKGDITSIKTAIIEALRIIEEVKETMTDNLIEENDVYCSPEIEMYNVVK
jgi:hypothetical protein